MDKLDHIVDLGITGIEIMPVAEFPGRWNWGYDGVLLYAPDASYGRPDDLKALVQAAHARGLMVLLDVVYNHFGPDGNFYPSMLPRSSRAGTKRHGEMLSTTTARAVRPCANSSFTMRFTGWKSFIWMVFVSMPCTPLRTMDTSTCTRNWRNAFELQPARGPYTLCSRMKITRPADSGAMRMEIQPSTRRNGTMTCITCCIRPQRWSRRATTKNT
ncbi:MAG: alpha-amylase family glycosyl hydrolase [Janthinobacterium lividum]